MANLLLNYIRLVVYTDRRRPWIQEWYQRILFSRVSHFPLHYRRRLFFFIYILFLLPVLQISSLHFTSICLLLFTTSVLQKKLMKERQKTQIRLLFYPLMPLYLSFACVQDCIPQGKHSVLFGIRYLNEYRRLHLQVFVQKSITIMVSCQKFRVLNKILATEGAHKHRTRRREIIVIHFRNNATFLLKMIPIYFHLEKLSILSNARKALFFLLLSNLRLPLAQST